MKHVDKEEVQTGEVHVIKQTVHDTETIEVPTEREEIVVESSDNVRRKDIHADGTTIDVDRSDLDDPNKSGRN